jgi:hypothetical protein
VSAVPFDTLKLATRLESTGFTTEQARGAASALAESFEGAGLATKSDIREATAAARSDLKDVATAGKADLTKAVGELKAEIRDVANAGKADLAKAVGELRADLAKAVGELKEADLRLGSEITLMKWMLGLVIAGILALVLKAYFPQ